VRLFRFDAEISTPVTGSGSLFKIGPLTGPDSRVCVQAIHLPADGRVGRQAAMVPQLFAVVSGIGWVSGQDGQRRPIRSGQVALWAAGEDQEAYSVDGLSAVCLEGDFEVRALAITADIVVEDDNPRWPAWFESLSQRVWPAVQDIALRIDHVGSTAVPNLAAKPIIDIDVVVVSADDVAPVIERLGGIGYRWRGDLGVVGRQTFELMVDEELPPHHLYPVVENNRAHLDHWLLHDLLRHDG
jgi:GrpB-like predicted nucleotidyltransferase (UPF0157 family)